MNRTAKGNPQEFRTVDMILNKYENLMQIRKDLAVQQENQLQSLENAKQMLVRSIH